MLSTLLAVLIVLALAGWAVWAVPSSRPRQGRGRGRKSAGKRS